MSLPAMRSGPLRWLSSPASTQGIIIWNIRPFAPPAETTSLSFTRSTPSLAAVANASAITALVPIEMKLFTSLSVWPAPNAPASMIVSA